MAGKVSRRPARANRDNRETRLQGLRDAGVPKGKPYGGNIKKRLPMNMREVRSLLSAKGDHQYLRHPIGRKEFRYWDKLWQFKGRPYNKTPFKGESKARKQRQQKRSKGRNARGGSSTT